MLMKKHVFILSLAILTLFVFAACNRSTDTIIATTNWIDLGIISIPSTLTYDEPDIHGGILINGDILTPNIDIWGGTWLFASPYTGFSASVDELIESEKAGSLNSNRFLFDDGHMGFMFEFDESISWRREDNMMGLSLRHGGDISIFANNEDLILSIARTLTAPPAADNPFSAPLLGFFAGGMSHEDMLAYEELVQASWMGPITKAILVDIDEAGTPGMLALRLITPDGHPIPMLRLFSLYDGEVYYLDVGGIYAADVYVTVGGRVVEVMRHWGANTYAVFGIKDGRLVRTFSIHAMLNEDISDSENEYSYLEDGLWENARRITREEFEDIRIRYGLDNLIYWREEPGEGLRRDETEAIMG